MLDTAIYTTQAFSQAFPLSFSYTLLVFYTVTGEITVTNLRATSKFIVSMHLVLADTYIRCATPGVQITEHVRTSGVGMILKLLNKSIDACEKYLGIVI